MKLWSYPDNYFHWIVFVIGFLLFLLMIPVWIFCIFWWKRDSIFLILHFQAIFYNPWKLGN